MATRRMFLQGGIAFTTLATSRLGFAAGVSKHIPKILYERDVAECAAFGRSASALGDKALSTSGDLGTIWMHELQPQLGAAPFALAGMTSGAPLFCLEVLVRDYGLHPVFRIEHTREGGNRLTHRLTGGAPADWQRLLDDAGPDWPRVTARLIGDCASVRDGQRKSRAPELVVSKEHSGPTIYSWLLAPDPGRRGILAPS